MLQFAVYTRSEFTQIISFREIVDADNAEAARKAFLKKSRGRRADMVLGVKAFDRAARRCIEGGRWLA